jgi:hypothetical protein
MSKNKYVFQTVDATLEKRGKTFPFEIFILVYFEVISSDLKILLSVIYQGTL